ncbi:MAG TPA: efflux RND transporter permease subunit [Spirochaetota bacterium]|nr:efflux RND transporter permease subunit [Spirochaetota bacterium]
MYNKILSLLTRLYKKPVPLAVCGLVITALFAAAIPFIKFDNDIKNFLAPDHPHRLFLNNYDSVFGSSEMIFIGIESDNAYSVKTMEYIKWLKGEIEKLNWGFPAQSLSAELDLTIDEANRLIDAVNQYEIQGRDVLKAILESPERMNADLFWEMDFAKKVAGRVSRSGIDRVLQLYKFPVDDIKSVISIDYIRGEGDKFVVEKLIDPENINETTVAAMRGKVKGWNIYDKMLFSGDGTLTAVSIDMNPIDINQRQKFDLAVEKILKDNPREGLTIYLAGEPIVTDRVSTSTKDDLALLLPFVLLVILVILVLIFRHYEGVLLPMAAMIISVIWTVGTMAILGIPMSMVSITVPPVLTAVASAYGIHFMTHYYMSSSNDRYQSSVDSMKVSGLAIIFSALTTVAGFGSLVTSDMTHIKNYGVITAIGVFYSLVITVTLIPAFLIIRKSPKPFLRFAEKESSTSDSASRIITVIRKYTVKYPAAVLSVSVLIICISVYYIRAVELNMNTMDFFNKKSDIKIAENHLNEKLAGTQMLAINIESSDGSEVITPAVLQKVQSFQDDIQARFSQVGKTVSVNDYLKKMNQEMHGGKKEYYRIPDNTAMTREYLLLYSGDIDGVVSKGMDRIRVHLTVKRGKISDQLKIREYALSYFDDAFRKENRVNVNPSGFMDLMVEANMLIVRGQISSLLSSLILVAILMWIIFRNFKLTFISLLPLSVGIALNFGIMGFLGIPLNAVTAVVASIAIGMGIDYSIHFINRYRIELEAAAGDVDTAVTRTYDSTGKAILSNALSVSAGFMVLMFSEFPIIKQFGGLMAFTVGITGLAAVFIIPAALKIAARLEERSIARDNVPEETEA